MWDSLSACAGQWKSYPLALQSCPRERGFGLRGMCLQRSTSPRGVFALPVPFEVVRPAAVLTVTSFLSLFAFAFEKATSKPRMPPQRCQHAIVLRTFGHAFGGRYLVP